MIRTFHPIGQGAFYSERHNGLNIVYDCGCKYNNIRAERIIRSSFYPNTNIDILFISHFDSDHVNKISILKNAYNIKRVVLPLLEEKEIKLLANIYNCVGINDNVEILIDPINYFGQQTIVIQVDSGGSDNNSIEPINIEEINGNRLIQSGLPIKHMNWIFVPFNYKYDERHSKLKLLFNKNEIDLQKFTTDINYVNENAKKVKKIYDLIGGDINENSMLLYSGPLNNNGERSHLHFHENNRNYYWNFDPRRVGCLYTGDTNLNIVDISNVFSNYWREIGTIQIPHHGALKSFKINAFYSGEFCCPISFGDNNTYGHPSGNVLAELIQNNCNPIMITENMSSIFIEYIV